MQVRHFVALVPALAGALLVGSQLNAGDVLATQVDLKLSAVETRHVEVGIQLTIEFAVDGEFILVDPVLEYTGCIDGDLDCDGDVDAFDLAALLSSWNACDGGCFQDLNDDGEVNAEDLTILLAEWTGSL